MPAWLLPAVKMILPHVGTIVAAAKPVFTKRRADTSDPAVVQQQIAELQAAALRVFLPHLRRWNEQRVCLARRYSVGLRETHHFRVAS